MPITFFRNFCFISLLLVLAGFQLHAVTITIETFAEPPEGGRVTGGGTFTQNGPEPTITITATSGWHATTIDMGYEPALFSDELYSRFRLILNSGQQVTDLSATTTTDRSKTIRVRFERLLPIFTTPPADLVLTEAEAILSATVEGFGHPLTWQWFKNGVPHPSTERQIIFPHPAKSDAGLYYAVVSNAGGATTSRVARVTWWQDGSLLPPVPSRPWVYTGYYGYTNTPVYTLAEGDGLQLETRFLEQSPGVMLQWLQDGKPVGDGRVVFEIGAVNFRHAGAYTVRAWNAAGTNESPAVLISIPPRLKRYAWLGGEWVDVGTNAVYFAESTAFRFETSVSPGLIFYTLDGSEPSIASTLYSDSVTVTNSCIVRAVVFTPDFAYSAAFPAFTVNKSEAGVLEHANTVGGWFLVESRAPYVIGSTIKVRPVVARGAYESSKFLGWMGTTVSTQEMHSFTMEPHVFVHPLFGTAATVAALGSGEILGLTSGELVPFGNVLHLMAVPKPGFRFVQWGGSGAGTNAHLSFTNIGPNLVVTALFTPLPEQEVTLTAITDGVGSIVIEPTANSYPRGTRVTIRAVPGLHQSFLSWSGAATGNDGTITLTLTESATLEARFTEHLVLRPSLDIQGGFRLEVSGGQRRAFRIEESSNLKTWGIPFHVPDLPGEVVTPRWWNLEPTYFRSVSE